MKKSKKITIGIIIFFLIIILLSMLYCFFLPKFLGTKVKGFNGDTCGASVVIVETLMLLTFAILL